ncbi:hypothetical protein N7540_010880 [Penicillium herquei]|nr:hypothetical protein N7540_010880 [Penicillium herquei]
MAENKSNHVPSDLSTADPGSALQVKFLEQHQKEGENAVKEKSDPSETERATYYEYALVSTEFFDTKDAPFMRKLRINSLHLCNVLKNVVKCYPAYQMGFSSPIEIESPFGLLYHHLTELSDSQTLAEGVEKEHLNLLFSYLRNDTGFAAAELINKGLITFSLLWAVFKPGAYVRTVIHSQPWILWLQSTTYRTDKDGDYLELKCFYSASNGDTHGKAVTNRKIYQNEFSGRAPALIEKLSVIPLERCPDSVELKSSLKSRGEKAISFKNGDIFQHKGLFVSFDETKSWDHKLVPYTKTIIYIYFGQIDIEEDDTLFLYEPFVYGYSLDIRRWGKLFVQDLEPVNWDNNMFTDLILAEAQRKLLKSLVLSHLSAPDEETLEKTLKGKENISSQSALPDSRDLTETKGKGLVVVLHGPPGTGKTMTAVAMAEDTKRPVLMLPAGELGQGIYSLQSKLRRVVEYATSWKAILLIDEADVFLEKRETGARSNLERNALVAVFLNQLEYCQGIVFLTSNRAELFDPAIKSRVHLMLHYPQPNRETRKRVWESHLNKVPSGDIEIDLSKAPASLSRFAMNGRDISNSINSAMTLAKHDAKKS